MNTRHVTDHGIHHRTGRLAAHAGVAAPALAMLGPAHADSGPDVINPNSNAYGRSFQEWTAEWWQAMLSIPTPANPLTDTWVSRFLGAGAARSAALFAKSMRLGSALSASAVAASKGDPIWIERTIPELQGPMHWRESRREP